MFDTLAEVGIVVIVCFAAATIVVSFLLALKFRNRLPRETDPYALRTRGLVLKGFLLSLLLTSGLVLYRMVSVLPRWVYDTILLSGALIITYWVTRKEFKFASRLESISLRLALVAFIPASAVLFIYVPQFQSSFGILIFLLFMFLLLIIAFEMGRAIKRGLEGNSQHK